ncbi:hypothetical protein L1D14_25600 [Vibrio tubiashii]|uniref:hypothetical protein n=1 Tax=Vibrio tubiashii TaxID=29498 RepID=UPI001EFEEF19|nr:hypothetical protein [Vibrio tubiashii]MCG9579587.1 hypothetical protein [Vibrio tubiashii]
MIKIPSLTSISNMVADLVQENAYSHCNILCPSNNNDSIIINLDGSVFTAFEVIGTQRYLTPETEHDHIQAVQQLTESTLRKNHHKLGIMYVRDPNRTEPQLNEIYKPTLDTIQRLGMEADHFFIDQKADLAKHCSFERTLLIVSTAREIAQTETQSKASLAGEEIVIDEMPILAQDPTRESADIIQEHEAFLADITGKLSKYLGIIKLTSETYFKYLKEEEELVSLSKTRWRSKSIATPVDITLNANENDFITHPPYAYQIITDDKYIQNRGSSVIQSGDYYVSTMDREYFNIQPHCTFQDLFNSIDRKIPFRVYFELETGTDRISKELSARKTFLILFKVSAHGRSIDAAIDNLLYKAKREHRTLLKGHMSIATWGTTVEKVKKQKRDLKQAVLSWGSPTVNTPNNLAKGYFSTLPAFAKKPSSRPCVQLDEKHLSTLPITRPATPIKTGAICMSSSDGKLYPINPTSSEQDYSANAIIGAMKSGKTVYSAILNNAVLLAEGNEDIPLMAYADYGSGVHNYIRSIRSWLPQKHLHKVELITLKNEEGNGVNIFEPQFGLERLEEQEKEFAVKFLSRAINGESDKSVSGQLSNTLARLIGHFFDSLKISPIGYEAKIGSYVKEESRYHKEINKLMRDGVIRFDASEEESWYKVRDKLFTLDKEKYFAHARFAHRQGSGDLQDFTAFIKRSPEIKEMLEKLKVETGGDTSLCDYITISLDGIISRFKNILGRKSQIDVSQAKLIGIDAKPILQSVGEGSTRKLFGLLIKQLGCRNFWRDPKTFMDYVPELYREHYKEVLESEKNIKKHDFTDEYKQFKSDELDEIMDNTTFIARKYNLCITIAAQLLEHVPKGFLDLATNIYVLSASPKCADLLQTTFKLSDSLVSEMRRKLTHSEGFGRLLLYIGKFNRYEGYVVQILRNQITPSYLWNFASEEHDETIKYLARMKYGERSAFQRLAKQYPSGSIVSEIERLINDTAHDEQPLTTKDAIRAILDSLRYAA